MEEIAKKQTLYSITEEHFDLMNQIEEMDGELTPEMEKALEINSKDLEKKSVGYLEVIKGKEAFNMVIDEEIKRLQALKKRNKNLIDTLKDRLLVAVNIFGEFTVGTLTFKKRKSTSCIISDADSIPKEYKVKTITESIQKNEIKKALNNGEIIYGAELVTNYSLMVK